MEIVETPAGDVTRNCKNYLTDGGDRLVIGGLLEILEGASVTGLPPASVSAATEETLGCVKLAANQAASTATEVSGFVAEFNTLLAALKAAGIMAADESGAM